uniref:Putative ribonuclease H-like domain-containing protein n=1 Tax=Tanacetum cinerariifolium TaxID=118510 RepID=A0A6L2LVY4_TANCI|nr:putative ribonuclease H-like domain-containing protein [Tanacetum cinerariifolium]
MHSFDSSHEITNSSICILPRVKFPSHDPVVHHSGHDNKRRVEVNVGFFNMHMPNVAWYLKVGGASSHDDGVSKKCRRDWATYKDIIAGFCGPSRWKELSKESGSKILPCGDGSCWKAFKPIAILIACSRHMTRNMSYLSEYEEIDGRYVTFGRDPKGGKITGKGKISTDRKSTIGGYEFRESRLISWQCKKQTVVANSTTEAEYVAASSCCGHVLWIQNQMLDYRYNFMNTKIFIDNESTICIVKNPFHSKTKHIEIGHHFIRDSNEKKLIQMIKIHTDHNVADLLTKAFDVDRFQYLIARKLTTVVDVNADEGLLDDEEVVAEKEVSTADLVTTGGEVVTTAGVEVSATATTPTISMDDITLAKALAALKSAKPMLAERLQVEEQGELTTEERSKLFVELMNERKKHFARLRAEEKRRNPPTKAQKRKKMCNYLKNMAGFTHNQLKNKSFEEVQKAFDNTMSWTNSFVPIEIDKAAGTETRAEGSSKRA